MTTESNILGTQAQNLAYTGGTKDWTNVNNALATSTWARCPNAKDGISKALVISGFTFSTAIPDAAVISDLTVIINKRASFSNEIKDYVVGLTHTNNATLVSLNNANTVTFWGTIFASTSYSGDGSYWYSTASDLNPTNLNSANFGVIVLTDNVGGQQAGTVSDINYVDISVTYSIPSESSCEGGMPRHIATAIASCIIKC